MKSSSLLLCAALGAALLCAGCDSAPSREPKTTRTFVLSVEHPTPDVEMGLVSAIRVVLPGPDAGSPLRWEIVANNNKVLEQMGALKPVSGAGEPGTGASTEARFYSLKPGKSVLEFVLVNPAATEAAVAAKCELTVRVADAD
jgi:hypothetical protein